MRLPFPGPPKQPDGVRLAPGPAGTPLLGSLVDAWRDPFRFYLEARSRYGDVVRFPYLVNRGWHFIAHPDEIEYVLLKNSGNYTKGFFMHERLSLLIGNGLFNSEGDFWRRQRRLAQPAFHRQRIANLAQVMTTEVDAMLDRWTHHAQSGRPFDVVPEMMRVTLQIVGRALFGTDLSQEASRFGESLTICLEHVHMRMIHPFALREHIPIRQNRRFLRARRMMDRVVYKMIAEHRRSGEDRGDLLSMLMAARDEDTHEGMTDLQLHDEIMTLLLAGHETVAITLSWASYLLSRHPAVRRRLQHEVATVLEGRIPTADDVPKLVYTRMIIEETLRLYPPVWMMSRQTVEDDTIRGYPIPRQTTVVIMPYVTHRHPQLWDNPEGFDPERFSPENTALRPRFAYLAFGGGPRLCLGNNFAIMEAQLMLSMIAQKYQLHAVPGHPVEPLPSLTLRPAHGLMMTLHNVDRRGDG